MLFRLPRHARVKFRFDSGDEVDVTGVQHQGGAGLTPVVF